MAQLSRPGGFRAAKRRLVSSPRRSGTRPIEIVRAAVLRVAEFVVAEGVD